MRAEDPFPIYVGRYLRDTANLDCTGSGAYIHALMYQFVSGPLPDDMEQCARIMKLGGTGAPEIARALLHQYFKQTEDGAWINLRCQAVKQDQQARAIRFSKRGVKANQARWKNHTPKWPTKTPARILRGEHLLEQGILESKMDSSKDSSMESLLDSTSDAYGVRVLPSLDKAKSSSSLRSDGGGKAAAAAPVGESGSFSIEHLNSKTGQRGSPTTSQAAELAPSPPKAKIERTLPKSPPKRPAKAETAGSVTPIPMSPPTHKPARNPGGRKGASDPPKQPKAIDPRFTPFRREFFVFWSETHPSGIKYPWDSRDGGALNRLLRSNPHLLLEEFGRLLLNRASSDLVNISAAPHSFLPSLTQYAGGAIDKHGRMKKPLGK